MMGIPRATIIAERHGSHSAGTYGFRSWMLQDMEEEYEVVLCLFNDR